MMAMETMNWEINKINIAVVGLGYVGLPTAVAFHKLGYSVIGIDTSIRVIEKLNKGENSLIDNALEIEIPFKSERWKITNDYSDSICHSNIIIITVPTPVNSNKKPDLSYIRMASEMILDNLNKDNKTIIILESTVYPGITRNLIGKMCIDKGIIIGRDIELAYCPERVSPGDIGRSAETVARVLGCDNEKIGKELAKIYSQITNKGCTYVGKLEVAEAAKLIENVQRDIDIAFVNELSIVLPELGLDVEEVLDAASTKWNFHRHSPGIGVGGHCIPVDPYYYIDLFKKSNSGTSISERAREINENMPIYSASKIINLIGNSENKNILILGYSYKRNVGDVRETPVAKLINELQNKDFNIELWDPLVPKGDIKEKIKILNNPFDASKFSSVILCTNHDEINQLDYSKLIELSENKILYDGRRALNGKEMKKIGWNYNAIGKPECNN